MAPDAVAEIASPYAAPAPEMAGGFLRRERTVQDVDEQAALLDTLDQRYEQLSAGRYSGGLLEISFDGVDVFRERIDQSVQQRGVGRDVYWTFATALELSAPAWWDGGFIEADTVICFEPRREFDLRTPRVAECVGFSVTDERLQRHLATCGSVDARAKLRGRSVVTRDRARQDRLRALLAEAIDMATRFPALFEQPAPRTLLVDALLQRLADSLETQPVAQRLDSSRQTHVAQRSRDYVYARLSEPFSIAELCEAVGCSRRTLQYAFESVFGVNPVSYIRAVRLNGARRDLKSADRATSVQETAARWGFWHLPRFAGAYARMFGELPSATLRAARAGYSQA
ncbi:MAG: helix-turn-helix domain-containing protein [Betaproteobacteria bacterium]